MIRWLKIIQFFFLFCTILRGLLFIDNVINQRCLHFHIFIKMCNQRIYMADILPYRIMEMELKMVPMLIFTHLPGC